MDLEPRVLCYSRVLYGIDIRIYFSRSNDLYSLQLVRELDDDGSENGSTSFH